MRDPCEGPGDREPPLEKYYIKYYIYKMALNKALRDPSPGDPGECGLSFDTPPLDGGGRKPFTQADDNDTPPFKAEGQWIV